MEEVEADYEEGDGEDVDDEDVDEDCSGAIDDLDLDGDGFFPAGCGLAPFDCNDANVNAAVFLD